MADNLHKPAIPDAVRTAVYFVGLAIGTLTVLVTGVAAVWWPDHATEVLSTAGAFTAAASFLTGALGVAYRPTGPHPGSGPAGPETAAGERSGTVGDG